MGFNRLPRCCSKADLPDGDYVHVRDDDYCWASALRPVVFLLAIPSLLLLVVANLLEILRVHCRYSLDALSKGHIHLALLWFANYLVQIFFSQSWVVYFTNTMVMIAAGDYEQALNVSSCGAIGGLLAELLLRVPWPAGHSNKLKSFAQFNFVEAVKKLTNIADGWSAESFAVGLKLREREEHMIRYTSVGKGGSFFDKCCAHVVEIGCKAGAGVNRVDEDNWTVMMNATRHGFWKTVQLCYENGSNVDGQGSDDGASNLHLAIDPLQHGKMVFRSRVFCDTPAVPSSKFIQLLLNDDRLDPCAVNFAGLTAYMVAFLPEHVEALRPQPSWALVENVLLTTGLEACPQALFNLIAGTDKRGTSFSARRLRFRDLLFCHHEGDDAELTRRRDLLFHRFLGPFMKVCTERQLKGDERHMFLHAWEASKGSRQGGALIDGRKTYAREFDKVVDATMSAFEDELRPVREALLHDAEEGGKLLSELPEVEIAPGVLEPISQTSLIPDSESSELMAEPAWALSRDLKAAYLDLKRIGVINDASDLCLLLSIGENHLLPRREKAVFKDASSLDFWMGMVALYCLGLHKLVEPDFKKHLEPIGIDGELRLAPMKTFPRVIAKSHEYIEEKHLKSWKEQVFSPFHVLDVLRCSFTVQTARRSLEIGEVLLRQIPLVRSKNGHHVGAQTAGGYADRKLNLAMTVAHPLGQITVVVEVQLVLMPFLVAKKRMHAVYRVSRGDFNLKVPKQSTLRRMQSMEFSRASSVDGGSAPVVEQRVPEASLVRPT